MILLCSAVEAELAFWKPRPDVERIVTGVGPVEAACALAAALVQRPYRLVVNAGLAGAFEGAAAIGDGVVVAEDAIELGLETGAPIALPSGAKLVDEARSTAGFVEQLRAQGFPVLRGVTVSRVTSSEATANRLASELSAQVETMEGFAALRAAELAGVPAIELRGISNRCGDRALSGWNFGAGVAGLRRIVEALFQCIR
ncbi:MAG TPA: futalosine hydrolase [Candidatus Nitrosotalea sp.]|nr:futalosine hydrolase [Candidatus Nitrosotalea sp.]